MLSDKNNYHSKGMVVIATMMLLAVVLSFLAVYTSVSQLEVMSTGQSKRSISAFYAAEAGLNLRASVIRNIFKSYSSPSGVSPATLDPCVGSNAGSGDYRCITYNFGNRTVKSFVIEEPGNPIQIKIPAAERYGGLNASEYRYTAHSQSTNSLNEMGASLRLTFRSREVPLFQFAAYYNKDLEILPGPPMTLSGPVHTNMDLYLNGNEALTIKGKVSAVGNIYRGRKNDGTCVSNTVSVFNPITAQKLVSSCPNRRLVEGSDITPFNGQIEFGVPQVVVPSPDALNPTSTSLYWREADLRVVLNLTTGNVPLTTNHATGIEVRNVDGTVDLPRTTRLHACSSSLSKLPGSKAVQHTATLFNGRENGSIWMLELDMQTFLDCIHTTFTAGDSLLVSNRALDDATQDGLVIYLTVRGPRENNAKSRYGVRVRNGKTLQSSISGARSVKGITVVTNQAMYAMGDYNSPVTGDDSRIPASFLGDTFQVLSNAWPDVDYLSTVATGARDASSTTINAAVLAGTDTTGDTEGPGGWDKAYNGGLENYPRFLEYWYNDDIFTYRGSFVSLNRPLRSNGGWGSGYYDPPVRVWDYDKRFDNARNLPPLTPKFVYLRQELFVRDFSR